MTSKKQLKQRRRFRKIAKKCAKSKGSYKSCMRKNLKNQ